MGTALPMGWRVVFAILAIVLALAVAFGVESAWPLLPIAVVLLGVTHLPLGD